MTKRGPRKDEAERVTPASIEAEKAVIGAVLINPALLPQATGILKADQFWRRKHQDIWSAIVRLADERRIDPDPLTVQDELARAGLLEDVGGAAYVLGLTDGVPRSSNIAHYAHIVREKWLLRQLIRVGSACVDGAYADEAVAAELINDADGEIVALQKGTISGRLVDLRTRGVARYDRLEHSVEHRGELRGIDTGFESLNQTTFGWNRGDMIVIAARPSMGKTAFVLNAAVAACRSGKRVALFSMEMRTQQIEDRILAALSGLPLERLKGGFIGEGDTRLAIEAMGEFDRLPLFVDDRGSMTVWDIRASCRRLRAEEGLDLVVVDYVQLVQGSLDRRNPTRNEEMTDISRRLKVLADEVQCPVIVLSQLKRLEHGRRPTLQDLRESGSLEQDADLVCFLHRKDHRQSGKTQFIIEKDRNGSTGTVNLTLDRETQRFADAGIDLDQPAEEHPPAPEGASTPEKPRRQRRRVDRASSSE